MAGTFEKIAPVKAASAYCVEVGGEAVILDEATQHLHLLNPTASLLWACFDGESTAEEIATDVAEILGVPYREVLRDTVALIERLTVDGLLVGLDDGTQAGPDGPGLSDSPSRTVTAALRGGNDVELETLAEPPNP